ncbi:MAG TPA: DUF4136 domain-containing protein [Steroidobacteraceae bacterium]|nr:DUF4136 domain-containing protein [Steroidobacteraceae bacterium]
MPVKKVLFASAAGAALAALAACSSMPVTTDVNPNASVAVCHTYAWAHEQYAARARAAGGNPLNADRLRIAIQSNLAARGIRLADDAHSADCVVGYAIGSHIVADQYAGLGLGFGYGWGGWGRRGYGDFGYDWPTVRDEGRISIDLFDAKTRQAIWHASVNRNVTELTGADAETAITAAAAAMFNKFPLPSAPPASTSIRPVT